MILKKDFIVFFKIFTQNLNYFKLIFLINYIIKFIVQQLYILIIQVIRMNKGDFDYSDKYENFHLNEIKELQSFNATDYVLEIYMLNDGRILTNETHIEERENKYYKLCVYSVENGFNCDISIDFEMVKYFFQMNDGNVIIILFEEIKIVKIEKNTIEEIWNEKKKRVRITKLLNENFFIYSKEDKQRLLYKYDNGKLISYKNLDELYKKESFRFLCQINENEYALFSEKKGILYGTNNYLIFYDMKNEKTIKSIKIGDGEKTFSDFFLLNKDNLIIFGNDSNILVDVKNKKIKKEFKYGLFLDLCIFLNEKLFLYKDTFKLLLYEYQEPNNIILKEEKKMGIGIELISKYPGNKLIIFTEKNNKLSIYG